MIQLKNNMSIQAVAYIKSCSEVKSQVFDEFSISTFPALESIFGILLLPSSGQT